MRKRDQISIFSKWVACCPGTIYCIVYYFSTDLSCVLGNLPNFHGSVSGPSVLFHWLFFNPGIKLQHFNFYDVITSLDTCWEISLPPFFCFRIYWFFSYFSINFRLRVSRSILLGWSLDVLNLCSLEIHKHSLSLYLYRAFFYVLP